MERITANNFITDDKTDKVYISSLIDKASGALDAVSKNEQANEVFEKAAGAVEKKTGVDVPSAGDLSKMLGQ